MTKATIGENHKRFIEEMNATEVRETINEKTVAILVLVLVKTMETTCHLDPILFSLQKLQKELLLRQIMLLFFPHSIWSKFSTMTNFR
jgi:hypothetical protein